MYNILIHTYDLLIRIASSFHSEKAKLFVAGRKGLLEKIKQDFQNNETKIAWFHCASLGEFEQGRPVMEAFRDNFPDYKILLTFYSPSGYELKKGYSGADFIYYLPMDKPANARNFIDWVNPSIAFFVKYEFWPNYLKYLHKKGIPILSFSTIFRKEQVFFKWYGKSYRNLLKNFSRIFLQNDESATLMDSIGIENYEISGDTRFDRVNTIANSPKDLPEIKEFVGNSRCMVVGSSWPLDMEVLLPLIKENELNLKFIIAPHEIREEEIAEILESVKGIRFSKIGEQDLNAEVLIIDSIGLLSSIYQFADVAYVGGAFGKGLHNILEAAIFRIPVYFGNRNYKKFQEANDLIRVGAAAAIQDSEQLRNKVTQYFGNEHIQGTVKEKLNEYITSNLGTTRKIIDYCKTIVK